MFINEIVINKNQGFSMRDRCMQSHDMLLFYRLSDRHIYIQQYEPYRKLSRNDNATYRYYFKKYGKEKAEERIKKGKMLADVWDIRPSIRKSYPTEKPELLLKRIVKLSTK